MGLSLSFSPWMTNLAEDMSLSYLTYFAHLDDRQSLSSSLRYLSYGEMPFYDTEGILQSHQNPNEFALDFAYAIKLSDQWGGAVSFRYIRSDMARGSFGGVELTAGNAFAADVAFYYRNTINSAKHQNAWNVGIVCSNIGTPVSYDDGTTKNYLPANMRLGGGFELDLNDYNRISFSLDFNKLMVPTPNFQSSTTDGGIIIMRDSSSDYSTMGAIFRSFTDAPGGLKEELQEITTSVGMEYLYNEQFAFRTGLFSENKNKGDRRHLTFGAGVSLRSFVVDLSYLYALAAASPLQNTIRFTVGYTFANRKK